MTGFDEAKQWLKDNAPEWLIASGRVTLEAGRFTGAPTEQRAEVQLVEADGAVKQSLGFGHVTLTGEGRTYLEAVQNAVGAYRSS